jgi:Avidin family
LLAIVLSAGVVSNAVAQGALPAPSTWKNQRGSILEITSVDPTGVIKGKFTNNAPNTKCLGTIFDIVGHTLKNGQIFFGVTFTPCNTITSWHGSVAGTTYSTTWALSTIDDETGVIETISGADTFTQQ